MQIDFSPTKIPPDTVKPSVVAQVKFDRKLVQFYVKFRRRRLCVAPKAISMHVFSSSFPPPFSLSSQCRGRLLRQDRDQVQEQPVQGDGAVPRARPLGLAAPRRGVHPLLPARRRQQRARHGRHGRGARGQARARQARARDQRREQLFRARRRPPRHHGQGQRRRQWQRQEGEQVLSPAPAGAGHPESGREGARGQAGPAARRVGRPHSRLHLDAAHQPVEHRGAAPRVSRQNGHSKFPN